MSDMEYVRVPAELAKKIEACDDDDRMLEEAIDKYFDWSVSSMQNKLESLNETEREYRVINARARNSFKEVAIEISKSADKIWEDWHAGMPQVTNKIEEMRAELKPLKDDLDAINKSIKEIGMWDIEKLLEMMNAVRYTDETTHNMVKFLMDNFKK